MTWVTETDDRQSHTAVVFLTHTRPYGATDVLPALAQRGYTTTERPHDRDTERMLTQFAPDVVVLAVDPRNEEDLALIQLASDQVPGVVLVLTPGPHAHGFVAALEAGADVCIRETDGIDIFAAQLASLDRKRRPAPFGGMDGDDRSNNITVRDLLLDFDRCLVTRGDEALPFSPTEFKILAHLAQNAGKVVRPVEVLRAIHGHAYADREAQETVKVYVRRIRRKLEVDPADPDYIITVRGFGYMLERRTSQRERAEAAPAA